MFIAKPGSSTKTTGVENYMCDISNDDSVVKKLLSKGLRLNKPSRPTRRNGLDLFCIQNTLKGSLKPKVTSEHRKKCTAIFHKYIFLEHRHIRPQQTNKPA